jgi:hypothetical protein
MTCKQFRTFLQLICGILLSILLSGKMNSQVLKSIVYDFDGFDLNLSNLPEGDYSYGDLSYKVTSNPLQASDMLGDRVLELDVNWSAGYGAFGRGISRYIEFDVNQDVFNFYFYNPASNNQDATLEIAIADDDNQNNTYESASDDSWRKSLTIHGAAGWQLISIPLNNLTDANTGGNGIFDVAFSQNKGMLLLVEFRFNRLSPGLPNAVFYMDMISFSEGNLPRGATELDLPTKDPQDYCFLGAFQNEANGANELIPGHTEVLFPGLPNRKLKYVNTFMAFAANGSTVASGIPGNSIQSLINNGYLPIITWEPYFLGFAPLDPVQPHLTNIINGDYNSYIDQFADKIKTYSDTVIIRLMHEFEGDWYPWCVSQNNQDPNLFITAYRKIVDRFRTKNVTNVLWMWCGNSDYAPYLSYNWMVKAYPGDSYIDIVATDVYNNIYPANLPWWRSFRWQTTESYYYLTKYFPAKPVIVCELGCRERTSGEMSSSESKASWFERMDKELQSNFHKIRGLIFFNAIVGQNWFVNTSSSAVESVRDNIWYDDYYFNIPSAPLAIKESVSHAGNFSIYPNPSNGIINFNYDNSINGKSNIKVINALGSIIYSKESSNPVKQIKLENLPSGLYVVELKVETLNKECIKETKKIVVQ